jgi:MoCo/4Fe-4S cofactor protein with predicted Tat translocation signal
MSSERPVDLAEARRRLQGTGGRRYWKSLEELCEAPGFLEFLHREFPEQASEWNDPEGRREFLRIMGASLALAGLTACTRQPEEKIVPYVKMPEEIIPGRPLFFATAVKDQGYAKGVLAESQMGRPTKIEGNPDHPGSLGATDVFGQAAILSLYDPDRSQTLKYYGEVRPWSNFLAAIKTALDAQRPLKGVGLRVLTGTVTSPTLLQQMDDLLLEFPEARFHQYEAAGFENIRAGATLAFGEAVEPQYHFDKAELVLALDADFISRGPANLKHIRDFASRRKLGGNSAEMNRLYVVESTPSLTGASADHRLPLPSHGVEGFARAVSASLGLAVEGPSYPAGSLEQRWVRALVGDMKAHAGATLVIAGETQPPRVHALAHAMNQHLGGVGHTVVYTSPVDRQVGSLQDLLAEMRSGKVDLLLILSGNPVYDAPADLDFAKALGRVPLRIHLSPYEDETSERCHWHIPEAHSLESWSDARAFDGTVSIIQPLIAPLYNGKSAHEVLAAFTNRPERSSHDIVKDYWKSRLPAAAGSEAAMERAWHRALHDGVVKDTALPETSVSLKMGEWGSWSESVGLELVFRTDPTVFDGRFSNNGWLQELPKPITKLTWDNAALMSLKTAEGLGLTSEDVVELRLGGRSVKAPVWITPGHADSSVTVHLGYGRTRAGRIGSGAGFNAYLLRTSDAPWFSGGLGVVKTKERMTLACTQDHWTMDRLGREEEQQRAKELIRTATLEEYRADPSFARSESPDMTLYPDIHKYPGHAWGLSIDLNSCVGCNACVVACQSENNIPVVGKAQTAIGREMHWIRIDRYFRGEPDKPHAIEIAHQPVLCMHCENAPCELVCPVAATVHSDEGLNDMVYNRCVGTRYCANNCPYKVRRFNFLLYQDWETPSLKLMRNPDVTVRSRGVMEKCTYCVQRINAARIDARNENRPIRDGEIRTACQQACPAEAIVFGDINDPTSRVSRLKSEPRNYGLLTELNTRPRTSYLASVKNPNPELTLG